MPSYKSRRSYPNQTGLTKNYSVPFPYLLKAHVKVYLVPTGGTFGDAVEQEQGVAFNFTSGSVIRFVVPPSAATVELRRETPATDLLLNAPTVITDEGINLIATKLLYIAEEESDARLDVEARAVLVPLGETGMTTTTAAARANRFFGFDSVGAFVAKTAAEIADLIGGYLPDALHGDPGPPGPSGNVGPWSAFGTVEIEDGTTLIVTSDTLAAGSSTGTASARYKLDPEQTSLQARVLDLVAEAVDDGEVEATALAAAATWQSLWRKQSANGKWFTLAEPRPTAAMFGCPGDGGQSDTNVMSGTDVHFNLQGFLDYCFLVALCPAELGRGTHRISKGLQHGYSRRYIGGIVTGAGQMFVGATSFPGTTIVCDSDEDPILNITGDRDIIWDGVTFLGKYVRFSSTVSGLCYPSSPPVAGYDCLNVLDWQDPTLRRSQNGRFNPYACVTLGAYDGARQVSTAWAANTVVSERDQRYANGNVYMAEIGGNTATSGIGPSGVGDARGLVVDNEVTWRYLGARDVADAGKYCSYREPYRPAYCQNHTKSAYSNANYGSSATFRNCTFIGGIAGLVVKPSIDNNQDDFFNAYRCNFVNNRYDFSAGNDQFRTLLLEGCNFGLSEAQLTNNTHGGRTGSFKGGTVLACSFGAAVDIYRMNGTYGDPLHFIGCYCEAQGRLGQTLGGGFSVMGPKFTACEFSFIGWHEERGVPARLHWDYPDTAVGFNNDALPPQTMVPTDFDHCKIIFHSVFTSYVAGATFRNSLLFAYDRAAVALGANNYRSYCDNATAGGLIVTGLDYRYGEQSIIFCGHNIDTGAPVNNIRTERGYRYGGRSMCIPAVVKSVRANQGIDYEELVVPHPSPVSAAMSSLAVTFPNAADLTEIHMVRAGTQATDADFLGIGKGGVMIHGNTGTVFFLESFDDPTNVIIGHAQNNYRDVGGVRSFIKAVDGAAGDAVFYSARMWTLDKPMFGEFTSGSSTIANVATSYGEGGADPYLIESLLPTGDYLVSPQELNALAPSIAKVTTRTNGAGVGAKGSIVLSQNATKTTVQPERLAFFRRPAL